MSKDQELLKWKAVRYIIEEEGIDYCFINYSNFTEIEDKKFHKLRKKLIKTINDMEEYVENKINNLQNKE